MSRGPRGWGGAERLLAGRPAHSRWRSTRSLRRQLDGSVGTRGAAAAVGCSPRRRSAGRLLRRQRWLAAPDWSRSPPTWTPRPTRWWGWRREPPRAAGEFPPPLAVVQQPFEEAPPPRRSGTPLVTLPATAATPESRRASAGRTGRPVCRGRGPRCGVPAESAAGWTVGVPTTARRRRGPGGRQPAGTLRRQGQALRPRRRPRAPTR